MASSAPPPPPQAPVPTYPPGTPPGGYYPPPPQAWAPPPPASPTKSNRGMIIVVAVIVVVLLVVVLIGAAALHNASTTTPGSSAPPPSTTPPPQTLIVTGQDWQLKAGTWEYVGPLDVNQSATVTGSFSADGGDGANAYILTSDEQQAFNSGSSTTPASYVWTSGEVSTGSANTNIGAGIYYIDFVNQADFSSTSVQVTTAFVATF
jgi:hypothetical protein